MGLYLNIEGERVCSARLLHDTFIELKAQGFQYEEDDCTIEKGYIKDFNSLLVAMERDMCRLVDEYHEEQDLYSEYKDLKGNPYSTFTTRFLEMLHSSAYFVTAVLVDRLMINEKIEAVPCSLKDTGRTVAFNIKEGKKISLEVK